MITQDLARQTINDYFRLLCAKEAEAWVQLFSEEAITYDPVGNPANHVHQNYLKFFGLLKFYREMKSEAIAMFFAGDEVAVHWEMQVSAVNGKEGKTSGISIFTFDEAGKISLLKAYWDDRQLMAQLR